MVVGTENPVSVHDGVGVGVKMKIAAAGPANESARPTASASIESTTIGTNTFFIRLRICGVSLSGISLVNI